MSKVKVILEKTDTGYSVYSPDVPGCIAVGENLNEAKKNFNEALNLFIETSAEFGDPIPGVLQSEFELEFKVDIKTFFEWVKGIMTQTGIAQISGLNKNLVSQYANGLKKPSPKQMAKIEIAFQNFGADLQSLSFSL